MRGHGQAYKTTLAEILPVWLSLCAIGIAVIVVDSLLAAFLPIPVRLVLAVCTAGAGFTLAVRLLFADAVAQVVEVMPVPIGRVARAILM